MHMCFLAFSHQYNTTFFPKPPTTFLTCFSRGERQKYIGKKVCFNQVSNSQPQGHGSDMLSTEPPRRASHKKFDNVDPRYPTTAPVKSTESKKDKMKKTQFLRSAMFHASKAAA